MERKLTRKEVRRGRATLFAGAAAIVATFALIGLGAMSASADSPKPSSAAAPHSNVLAGFAPAQPIDANKPWMMADAALAEARSHAGHEPGAGPLNAAAVAALPAKVAQMTMSQYDQLDGSAPDALIAPDRPVWVVTVHGIMATRAPAGVKPTIHNVFTEVYDAPTGTLVITAIGYDTLK